jgi:hypothetical protein
MKQFELFDDFHEQHFISIFNDQQIIALQGMSKKIPKIVRFLIADKFDDNLSIQQILFGNFIIQARPRILIFQTF